MDQSYNLAFIFIYCLNYEDSLPVSHRLITILVNNYNLANIPFGKIKPVMMSNVTPLFVYCL